MGRTSKPLTILALPPTDQWAEVEALAAQGHTIHTVWAVGVTYDIIIGERCHRMSEHERKWLKNAILEARRRKYPKATPQEVEELTDDPA